MSPNTNLAEVLRAGYADALDQPFLSEPGQDPLTYRMVDERAGAIAGALRSAGVEAGDRVVVTAGKSPDAVALYLACLRIGAVYLPLNPSFTAAEIEFYVTDAQAALLITEPGAATQPGIPSLTLDGHGGGTLADAAAAASPVDDAVPREPDDLAAMLYTSGTTGRPKGAMLTHRGMATNGRALHRIWGFGPSDVLIHSLPIFHVHGLFVALHCAMLGGSRVIFLRRFDVGTVLDALPGASVLMGVPTHYTRLLADDRFDQDRCRSMRLFTSGSAPMTESTHAEFTARTGHRILERYGMTECGIIASNPLDGERVPGTVGFALPDMELRVATDAGPCAPGETGIVEVRGPHLFAGYWQLPDKTAEAYRDDGWFITGDVGHADADGRVTLEGRASDMIISGGENIYPKEIELCLDETPGVLESAVVGVPDTDFGEAVVAYLVSDEPDLDLELVRSRLTSTLARFKHPKRYVFVDELPRNAMGKVQKAELRTRGD